MWGSSKRDNTCFNEKKTVQIRDMRLPIRVQEAMEMEVLLLYLVISNMKFLVYLFSGIFHES